MKKVVLAMLIILFGFVINSGVVYAANDMPTAGETSAEKGKSTTTRGNCGVLGDPNDDETFAYYLQQVFNVIRFLGPILVLVMTIIDLVKITAEQKQDGELQKIGVKTLKRLIYAVAIFILPSLITFIFNLIGLYGTCVV